MKMLYNDPLRGEIEGGSFDAVVVVEYLNAVLKKFGPPCDWCDHWDGSRCGKGLRPRRYSMEYGQWEEWVLRKHCEHHKATAEQAEERAEKHGERLCTVNGSTWGGQCTSLLGDRALIREGIGEVRRKSIGILGQPRKNRFIGETNEKVKG